MKTPGLVAAGFATLVGLVAHLSAQAPAVAAFEVVSIKPSNPDAPGPTQPPVGGRYTGSNVTLRQLIQIAYEFADSRIDGGPDWQTTRHFDIQAKAADPVIGIEAMRPMLKTLLADRFQLKVHTETREMPIYELVPARDDRQLVTTVRRSTQDCATADRDYADTRARDPGALGRQLASGSVPCAIMPSAARVPGAATMRANAASMGDLARFLSAATGRPVEDRTGLSGRYDWELTYDRAVRPQTTPTGASDPSASPSLTTALQEQLGLKIEPARGPVEVLVIDSAALPEGN